MNDPINGEPLAVSRARTLAAAFTQEELSARLLGGTAVYICCPTVRMPPLARDYEDADIAILNSESARLRDILAATGLQPEREFNAAHGDRRQLYYWADGMQLDVFVDTFEQCHKLDLKPWLQAHEEPVFPAAFLLLTKLQVVQITEKDLGDAAALIADNPDCLTDTFLVDLLARDWGWYTTVTDNFKRLTAFSDTRLDEMLASRINASVDSAAQILGSRSKTMAWKMRARIGRRVQWYELPEDK